VLLIALPIFAIFFLFAGGSRSVRHLQNVSVVEIDLGPDVEIRPIVVKGSADGESFSQIIERLHPYAAINGTYFDSKMRPLGDIVINGKLVNRGCYRNAMGVTSRGKVAFLHKSSGRLDWSGFKAGIAAGPRLVHGGRIALNPVADGFSRRSLEIQAWRSGVGLTKTGKLILVTAKESITLARFAQIMLDLGAVDALNLDGGGACGLYQDGRMLAMPALRLSNILAVFKHR